jgi:predicted nucleotidyltransferase
MPTEATHCQLQATPYADVNTVLDALRSGAQAALGDHFAGMVVHGSLASGDFDPERSDLDVLVVTADELPAEMLPALEAMHARLTASGLKWATNMEVSYIPRAALRRYDPAHCHHPALRADGSFAIDGHGSEWVIQRHIVREKGIVLAGPPAKTLIDPIGPNDLRRAVAGLLREWWEPQLYDPFRIRSSEYQAYAILTMCRMLYTLEHGTVASKPIAARWAQAALGPDRATLVEQALTWHYGVELDRLDDTLDFIHYTLERSRPYEPAPGVALAKRNPDEPTQP